MFTLCINQDSLETEQIGCVCACVCVCVHKYMIYVKRFIKRKQCMLMEAEKFRPRRANGIDLKCRRANGVSSCRNPNLSRRLVFLLEGNKK